MQSPILVFDHIHQTVTAVQQVSASPSQAVQALVDEQAGHEFERLARSVNIDWAK